MTDGVLAALSWNPEIKGALYVIIALLTLAGSAYLVLATNLGARLGFLVATAGLLGWLTTNGVIWWVYGQGIAQKAPQPAWKTAAIVTGDPGTSRSSAVEGFPTDWEKLDLASKEVADAIPVAEGQLVSSPGGPARPFRSATEFVMIGAFEKGGESHGILGLNFRPLDLWHRPRYLAVQVQKTAPAPEPVPGQPAPRAVADPNAPPVTVVLLRDLGAKRLYPAVFTISCGILFGLVCYQLHTRDKQAAERRAGGLQPVAR